jgi:DNA ligase (NAD+)
MDQPDAAKRINYLREELDKQNHNYYVLNNPEIDDYTFDQMMAELAGLESVFPEFFDPASPTQRVGSDISLEFKQKRWRILTNGSGNSLTKILNMFVS